ncbi:helix-turn-helix domain-containing protein [Kribbella sp. CA-293567]|uniref:helix-turn-helix domain-containing protein n=1 Tax=Kribbella sp. CA-293567 TaxID=3002436 RepID=UPI0022DE397B|nr:helix-turn-helix domain-containing protein [Kribbella sp. CA-293567]WBQ08502.1 tetratricopeptide repeat protein [Kribbella sp. CA-293567]
MTEESFGSVLRRLRLAAALTQEQLAERAELSVQAISALERGARRNPYRETVQNLADALNLTSEDRDVFSALSSASRSKTAGPGSVAARQLPLSALHFAGRIQEVEAVTDLLSAEEPRQAPRIITIQGMAGVGKTALAIRTARLTEAHYPDGQFYVQLNGFGAGQPLPVADALGHLLRATGLMPNAIPTSVERASTLLRSRLASKRALLVLDNAFGPEQVIPLLPGASSCAVLITSRQNMTTLPADRHVRLTPLDEAEAADLVQSIVGTTRAAAEPVAIAELVELCGRLPLALAVAAARLAARPTWSAQHLVGRLQDEAGRLDELANDHLGVRTALAVSISQLSPNGSRQLPSLPDVFALLGTLTGSDFGLDLAARLLNTAPHLAESALEQLVDVNLLGSPSLGRYQFHDLIHAYAREKAEVDLTEQQRQQAHERILRLYRAVAWRGLKWLDPGAPRLAWNEADWLMDGPALSSAQESFQWLDAEQANLAALLRHLASTEDPDQLMAGLVLGLYGYATVYSRIGGWVPIVRAAVRVTEDRRYRAALLHDFGIACADDGHLDEAVDAFRLSAEMFLAVRDIRSESLAVNNYSRLLGRMGRHSQAIDLANRSLSLYQQISDQRGTARALLNLSQLHDRMGAFTEHLIYATEGLVRFEQIQSDAGIANANHNVGSALANLGRYDLAITYLSAGMESFDRLGHRTGWADAARDLAKALSATGTVSEALVLFHQALTIAIDRSDDRRRASVQHSLGATYLNAGDHALAETHLKAAHDYYKRDQRTVGVAEEIERLLSKLND